MASFEEYAHMLGISSNELHLMWIAENSYESFVSNWAVCKDKKGNISHYYNERTGEKSLELPIEKYYIEKVKEERNKYKQMKKKTENRGFAIGDNTKKGFEPNMSNRASYKIKDVNRSSSLNRSNVNELEKSFAENLKTELDNLNSKMKVRLNKMIFDEKSKHKKEVMLNLFESLQTNLIRQSKDAIAQFKKNAQEEFEAFSKQLIVDYEKEIESMERSFKWKIEQEKDLIKEEFQVYLHSEKAKINNEINQLEKDAEHKPIQLTDFKNILEKNLQTKHEALIEKFKKDLEELQQNVVNGSSVIYQDIQNEFQKKLKSKIAGLASNQEYKLKEWKEEKDTIEDRHNYILTK